MKDGPIDCDRLLQFIIIIVLFFFPLSLYFNYVESDNNRFIGVKRSKGNVADDVH